LEEFRLGIFDSFENTRLNPGFALILYKQISPLQKKLLQFIYITILIKYYNNIKINF